MIIIGKKKWERINEKLRDMQEQLEITNGEMEQDRYKVERVEEAVDKALSIVEGIENNRDKVNKIEEVLAEVLTLLMEIQGKIDLEDEVATGEEVVTEDAAIEDDIQDED